MMYKHLFELEWQLRNISKCSWSLSQKTWVPVSSFGVHFFGGGWCARMHEEIIPWLFPGIPCVVCAMLWGRPWRLYTEPPQNQRAEERSAVTDVNHYNQSLNHHQTLLIESSLIVKAAMIEALAIPSPTIIPQHYCDNLSLIGWSSLLIGQQFASHVTGLMWKLTMQSLVWSNSYKKFLWFLFMNSHGFPCFFPMFSCGFHAGGSSVDFPASPRCCRGNQADFLEVLRTMADHTQKAKDCQDAADHRREPSNTGGSRLLVCWWWLETGFMMVNTLW